MIYKNYIDDINIMNFDLYKKFIEMYNSVSYKLLNGLFILENTSIND